MKCPDCFNSHICYSAEGVHCYVCGSLIPEKDWDEDAAAFVAELRKARRSAKERSLTRFTGQNECPDCGMPLFQVGEYEVTCPNCKAEIMFYGKIAISKTVIPTGNQTADRGLW